jgi:hypothetical protein
VAINVDSDVEDSDDGPVIKSAFKEYKKEKEANIARNNALLQQLELVQGMERVFRKTNTMKVSNTKSKISNMSKINNPTKHSAVRKGAQPKQTVLMDSNTTHTGVTSVIDKLVNSSQISVDSNTNMPATSVMDKLIDSSQTSADSNTTHMCATSAMDELVDSSQTLADPNTTNPAVDPTVSNSVDSDPSKLPACDRLEHDPAQFGSPIVNAPGSSHIHVLATSSSDVEVACALPLGQSDWTAWLKPAVRYLSEVLQDIHWIKAISKFVVFELSLGFPNNSVSPWYPILRSN